MAYAEHDYNEWAANTILSTGANWTMNIDWWMVNNIAKWIAISIALYLAWRNR